MATSETTAANPGLLSWLASHRSAAGTGVMIVGAAVAVLPTLLSTWYGTDFLGTVVFTGLLAVLVLGVGVSLRFLPDESAANPARILWLVLLLGGVGGLLIALTGVALTAHWSTILIDWLKFGKREGAGLVLLAIAIFLAGLFVMFLVLQLGRAEERSNPTLRRTMYGYNAAFSGILLLLILVVINVLVGIKIAWAVDATSTGEFSLSERTINMLKGLDKPLHFYVVWPRDDAEGFQPVQSLLENFESRSPQVHVEYISPRQDPDALARIRKAYPGKIDSIGVLLVSGDEIPENASFLKDGDLFDGFGNPPLRFRGEDKIDAALTSLMGGGSKTIVYFTQGLGEPNLTDSGNSRAPTGGDAGLGVLRDRLAARGNFDVRPLNLGPAEAKVPDDCKVLVVANPKAPLDPLIARSIRTYLVERKGKAVILTDVPTPPKGDRMPATGLEGILGEFNVEITGDRILSIGAQQFGDQLQVFGSDSAVFEVNPQLVQSPSNEVATAFATVDFRLFGVRLIRPMAGSPRRPEVQAQAFLVTRKGQAVWAESKWDAEMRDMVRGVSRDEPAALGRLAKEPLTAAVVVTDSGKPKLAVFGDTTFITNREVNERSGTQNFSLFASLLDWLTERPTSIGIEPRNLAVYSLEPTVRLSNLVFLPGLLAVVTILGLGLGVWVVRRR